MIGRDQLLMDLRQMVQESQYLENKLGNKQRC